MNSEFTNFKNLTYFWQAQARIPEQYSDAFTNVLLGYLSAAVDATEWKLAVDETLETMLRISAKNAKENSHVA